MFTRNNPTYKLENISHKRNLLDVKIIGFVSQNLSNFTFFLRLDHLCGLMFWNTGVPWADQVLQIILLGENLKKLQRW